VETAKTATRLSFPLFGFLLSAEALGIGAVISDQRGVGRGGWGSGRGSSGGAGRGKGPGGVGPGGAGVSGSGVGTVAMRSQRLSRSAGSGMAQMTPACSGQGSLLAKFLLGNPGCGAFVPLCTAPGSPGEDKAALLVADALAGKASPETAKKAFEAAAREAGLWIPFRGP
jgi:hypothetical protein